MMDVLNITHIIVNNCEVGGANTVYMSW